MRDGRRRVLGAVALALPLPAAWPQSARVPTVTRLVKIFLDLESQLAQASHRGDAEALRNLLADDFEMRVAQRPGVPTPRAEWLAALARRPASAAEIEQIAAHDHGAAVDVSFLLRPVDGAPLFIVDTWAKAGEAWRLQVRYAAPVAPGARPVPGESEEPAIPKK